MNLLNNSNTQRALYISQEKSCDLTVNPNVFGIIHSSHHLTHCRHAVGNDAMIAYAVTFSLVGITSTFMGGFHDSVSTLAGMAYGAENYTLAGQYLRTACLSYILGEIPMGIMWYFIISKVLHFMGYTEMIIDLAQNFVGLRIVINMMMGVNQSILNFLSTIDYEKFANVVYCIGAIANASFVAIAAYLFNVNLTVLGLIIWVNASIMLLIIVVVDTILSGVDAEI